MKEIEKLLDRYGSNEAQRPRKRHHLLIVDDDPSLRRGLSAFFQDTYHISVADSGIQALEIIDRMQVHAVILDIKMKGMDGFATYKHIKARKPELPVIFYTAFQSEHDLKEIINRYRPFGYLDKGDDVSLLNDIVARGVEAGSEAIARQETIRHLNESLEREAREVISLKSTLDKRQQFREIIGESRAIENAIEMCRRASNSDITVCLLGETGTGKELFAKSIHRNSSRRNRPLIVQNCAAVPDTLLHSDLFGHRRGSFTGAVNNRKGIFELAEGGTVFLDEIGDMSTTMQNSLLRVLQESEIKPLGSSESIKVNVRIITATNRDLAKLVKDGKFREDLFYRINIFPIHLPPLRERREDIPVLARHFIRENSSINPMVRNISRSALKILASHDFPGNVRELRNFIIRAMAMVDDSDTIEACHLLMPGTEQPADAGRVVSIKIKSTLKDTVEELEKMILKDAINRHSGKKTAIAHELGLSRMGLNKKIARYGLMC